MASRMVQTNLRFDNEKKSSDCLLRIFELIRSVNRFCFNANFYELFRFRNNVIRFTSCVHVYKMYGRSTIASRQR